MNPDPGWAEVTACVRRVLGARAAASQARLATDALWPLAARLDLTTAPGDYRQHQEAFWRHAGEFEKLLASARERAGHARKAAADRCSGLAAAIAELGEIRPRSAELATGFSRAHGAAVAAARDAGRASLEDLRARPLGPGQAGSVRTRLARRTGRDATRVCRDGTAAREMAATLVSWAVPGLRYAIRAFRAAVSAELAAVAAEGARWRDELVSLREGHAPLCRRLERVPDPPALSSAWAARSPDVAAALTRAAWTGVEPLSRGDRRWLRLTKANSYPRDLRTLGHGARGFTVRRPVVVASGGAAWSRLLSEWPAADAGHVMAASGLREHLTGLDELPRQWLRALETDQAAARKVLAGTDEVVAGLDAAATLLRAARTKWAALHERGPGGLSPAVRACLVTLAAEIRPRRPPARLVADLAGLARDRAELRVPVVAPMKAGKSTLLCALLGADIVPRRADVMTTVATRFVPVPLTGLSQPRLRMSEELVAGHARMLDAAVAAMTEDSVAALAVQPRLQELARRLRAGERGPLATSHTGIRDIRDVLTWLHDTVRLAVLTLPAADTAAVAGWIPEVTVPLAGTPEAGRLVLIDTPGPGEAVTSPSLAAVVDRHLGEAHGCLMVVDYTQLDAEAGAGVASLVSAHADTLDPRAVLIAVNRIDQRRPGDPGPGQVSHMVRHLLEAPIWRAAPVIETSAASGLAAGRYLAHGDPDAAADLLRAAYPVDPPDPPPDGDALKRLAATALRQSGLPELQAGMLERISRRVPGLAVDRALARASAFGAPGLADRTHWALRHSTGSER